MFKKILIANRGEIAVRVIRACRELGISSVVVYSEADRNSLPVLIADQSVCIGPALSSMSYLNQHRILAAAEITKADAIHPGYGFLSENASFAALCQKQGVTFIGPSPENMAQLGDKVSARKLAHETNVPMFPGSLEGVKSEETLVSLAREIGYPVIIKASAGGGGRGMKVVYDEKALLNAYQTASTEALKAFGNDEIFIEKYCTNAKHVEIQILADHFGNVIHLGERDCSLQRRHQKVLEESPCSLLTPELREKMGNAAVNLAKQAGYRGAGTVEFLLDDTGSFYFMEMNTRVQVEHPVSEMVSGIDIIKEQIKIANNEPLNLTQKDIQLTGHAIECRINAEHSTTFAPSPGTITELRTPGGLGIRLDSFIYQGCQIVPHYDSMIAKLIVHGKTRTEAIAKMKSALAEFHIAGINTNIDFHKRILLDDEFCKGTYNTSYLNVFLEKKES